MLKQPVSDIPVSINEPVQQINNKSERDFNYSITWLFIDIALIICSFIILNKTSWKIWSVVITAIIIIWSLRYKRALRQVARPKFWIFFVFITLITAFALTKPQEGPNSWQQGLFTGIQMNFRAAIIIVGFSVLGTELYNPVIRNFFLRTSFKNLPLALELAAESLPSFIANIPDLKSLVRKPVSIFYQVISQAERRLSEIKTRNPLNQKFFIVTGSVGSGKTTFVKNLIDIFRKNKMEVGGIISEKVISDSQITGYDLVNVGNGEKEVFLRQNEECGSDTIGRYTICPEGLKFGNNILGSLVMPGNRIVVIDEVGLLELQDRGWAESIDNLLGKPGKNLLLVVRNTFVDKVISKWDLKNAIIFNAEETDYVKAGMSVMEQIGTVMADHYPSV